jgi:hypothetical protein
MNAIVPKIGNAAVVEADNPVQDLQSAVRELQRAVSGMNPDDLVFEFTADSRGVFVKFRAYRHRAT